MKKNQNLLSNLEQPQKLYTCETQNIIVYGFIKIALDLNEPI